MLISNLIGNIRDLNLHSLLYLHTYTNKVSILFVETIVNKLVYLNFESKRKRI